MKIKNIVFTLLLSLGLFGASAQTPLTVAKDFTITTVEGNEIQLFDLLDQGKLVLLDFFTTG